MKNEKETFKSQIISILENYFDDYDEIAMQDKFINIAVDIEALVKNVDKEWIFKIIDGANAVAKQLIEDHFNRHSNE